MQQAFRQISAIKNIAFDRSGSGQAGGVREFFKK